MGTPSSSWNRARCASGTAAKLRYGCASAQSATNRTDSTPVATIRSVSPEKSAHGVRSGPSAIAPTNDWGTARGAACATPGARQIAVATQAAVNRLRIFKRLERSDHAHARSKLKPQATTNGADEGPGPDELARLARAAGRFGIDTEFVSEGRYKALLCLVQVVVRGRRRAADRPARPASPASTTGRSPSCGPIPRSRWCCTRGRRTSRSCGARGACRPRNIFDTQVAAGFAGFSAQAGYGNLLQGALGVRLSKSRQLHPLGPAPAHRGAALVRARGRGRPARPHRRAEAAADGDRPARVGARGVPPARGHHRRARARGGVAPAAAREPAEAEAARGGARAGRLARADRHERGPAARRGAARRGAGGDRQAPAVGPEGARAHSRHPAGHGAPARPPDHRRRGGRGAGRADPVRGVPPQRGRARATRR